MKILFKNFWANSCNYFPLIHVSLIVEERERNYKTISIWRAEFGLFGFCLIIEI